MKLLCFTVSLVALVAASLQAADEQMMTLRTDMPRPNLAGTPVAIRAENLETAAEVAARPPVMVPRGTRNLALGKPVSSSDPYPIVGMLEQIVDGEKDSDDGFFVELGDGLQWVQVDLEQEATIYGIAMWHFHSQERAYYDVVVQISNDPEFKDGVSVVFNNDHDNSSGLGKGTDKAYVDTYRGRVVGVPGIKGRYVRFYSRGNTSNLANHYIEVEVWGK